MSDTSVGPKPAPENVHGNVYGNVYGERPPKSASAGAALPQVHRPKIRHLTQSVDGWVYQRRAPRLFASHQCNLTFRKRIGVRSVPDARQVAAKFDRLVDALVFAAQEFHGPMMDMK
jgi:hypothetical protein